MATGDDGMLLSDTDVMRKVLAGRERQGVQNGLDVVSHDDMHALHLHFMVAAKRGHMTQGFNSFGDICRALGRDKKDVYKSVRAVLIRTLMCDVILASPQADDTDRDLAAETSLSAYRAVIPLMGRWDDANDPERRKWIDQSVAGLKEWLVAPARGGLRDALLCIWRRARAIMTARRGTGVTYKFLRDACDIHEVCGQTAAAAAAAVARPCDSAAAVKSSPRMTACCDVSSGTGRHQRPMPTNARSPPTVRRPLNASGGSGSSNGPGAATDGTRRCRVRQPMPQAHPLSSSSSSSDSLASLSAVIDGGPCALGPRGGSRTGGSTDSAVAQPGVDVPARRRGAHGHRHRSLSQPIACEPRSLVDDALDFDCSDADDDSDDDDDDARPDGSAPHRTSASSGRPVGSPPPLAGCGKRQRSSTRDEAHDDDGDDDDEWSVSLGELSADECDGKTTGASVTGRRHGGARSDSVGRGDGHRRAAKKRRASAPYWPGGGWPHATADPSDDGGDGYDDGNGSEMENDPSDDEDGQTAALQAKVRAKTRDLRRARADARRGRREEGSARGGVWRRRFDGTMAITDAAGDLLNAVTHCMGYAIGGAHWSDRGRVYSADACDAIAAAMEETRTLGTVPTAAEAPTDPVQRRRWRLQCMMGDVMKALTTLGDPFAIACAMMLRMPPSMAQGCARLMTRHE